MEEDGFELVKSKKSSKKSKKSTNIVLAEKIKEALSSEEISDFVRYLCSLKFSAIYSYSIEPLCVLHSRYPTKKS